MGKLTKRQSAFHLEACELVAGGRALTLEEREFVLLHWQESASASQVPDNAFFTPLELASDLALHVVGDRVIDLCAGTGRLAFACRDPLRRQNGEPERRFVCVERNPQFVEVGQRVMPEAEWICADVFDLPKSIGRFDTAICNPPFGRGARSRRAPRYHGPEAAYEVLDLAANFAQRGVFLIPQELAPFRYSGHTFRRGRFVHQFEAVRGARYRAFAVATGIELRPSCGIDTTYYHDEWRDVAPKVEVVRCDFDGIWHQPSLMEGL